MSILMILLIPFVGAFVSLYLGSLKEWYRDVFNIALNLFTLFWLISLYPFVQAGPLSYYMASVMGTGLYLKVDMLQYYLLVLTAVIWCLVTLYSTFYLTKHRNRNRYYFCYMLTCCFTFGIFMSENLLNLFTFFEAMTFSSYILVIHDEDTFSHEAGLSYLAMAISGGLVMLMGILVAFDYTDTLIISELSLRIQTLDVGVQRLIGGLLVIGFGVKASMFPLHTWLAKAYVASPTPATAILSGVLLKTGLYGLLVSSAVLVKDLQLSYVLVCLGVVNTLLGGFLALQQRNIKRIVAYSSMSQAGFMIMGIGLVGLVPESSGLALVSTVLFMISHGLSKVLLFLVVGVVVHWLRELSLTHIWGFGRNQLVLKILFAIGALGTMGLPGFSGFISKTLLHEAVVEAGHLSHLGFYSAVELFFYVASAMTVAYLLKLYFALFVSKNPVYEERPKKLLHGSAVIPMLLLAGAVIYVGLAPMTLIMPLMDYSASVGRSLHGTPHIWSGAALLSIGGIVTAGGLIYVLYVRRRLVRVEDGERVYINRALNWFSIEDDLYKPLLRAGFKVFTKVFDFIDGWMLKVIITVKYFYAYVINIDASLLKKLEWDRSLIDQSTDLQHYEIKDDLTLHHKPKTLKSSFAAFYFNISSINYTVLFVASVLVLVMAVLFLVR